MDIDHSLRAWLDGQQAKPAGGYDDEPRDDTDKDALGVPVHIKSP